MVVRAARIEGDVAAVLGARLAHDHAVEGGNCIKDLGVRFRQERHIGLLQGIVPVVPGAVIEQTLVVDRAVGTAALHDADIDHILVGSLHREGKQQHQH